MCLTEKIETVQWNEFSNCIVSILMDAIQEKVVVTIVAMEENEEIWSEVELEAKKDVLNWIRDFSKSCKMMLIHLSLESGIKKCWRIQD